MAGNKDDDAALALFLIGLLIALAIIVLPFIWSSAREELSKPHVSVIVSEDCKEGSPCQVCSQDGNKKTCTDGVCDAKANCITPMQQPPISKYPIRGLAGSVK